MLAVTLLLCNNNNSFPVNFAGGHPGVSPSPFVEAMAARAAANSSVAAFNGSHSNNNNGGGGGISGNASSSSTSSTPFSSRGAVGGNSRGGAPFSGINAPQRRTVNVGMSNITA
eukprot:9902-Heterococcus_DN1.PRE.2